MSISTTQVASSLPYDNSVTNLGTGDVQSAIDSINIASVSGPVANSISSTTSAATSSTTYLLLNAMTISPTQIGNWTVIFTGQFQGMGDAYISVFVGGTQITNSERITAAQIKTANFIMATSEKVAVSAGQAIEIRWKTTTSAICIGRNLTIMKVN